MSPPDSPPHDVLRAAIDQRRATAPDFPLTVHRWINGPGDGAPAGLALDRYGDDLVVHARETVDPSVVRAYADAADDVLSPRSIVLKSWAAKVADSTSQVLRGPVPPTVEVQESDAHFLCALDDGVQTGLFLDHRDTRLLVRQHVEGREVLNAFAYTCAFSVHAALAGAARVTSVDVSKRALLRGRENMTLSGLDPNRHRWFDDDVLAHLARGGPTYDVVVLDPPLYGRTKKRSFALLRDLDELAAGAVRRLRPQGLLVFSTHALDLDEGRLERAVRAAAPSRAVEVVARMGLPPWDHPVRPGVDGDRGDYLDTLVLRFD